MIYPKTIIATFIDRPNRFVANVKLNEETIAVHVKNTGRCRELLVSGAKVILADSDNESRKYRYDLVTVWKDSVGWVNIDSQAPNAVMLEYLRTQTTLFPNLSIIKPETKFGDSRFDFYLEYSNAQKNKVFLEVKGCTLEFDGQGYFPDAPTQRGVKHIYELIEAKKQGYEAYLAFVIAMENVKTVLPYTEAQPEFKTAIEDAKSAGVKILYMHCSVSESELKITDYCM